MNVDPDCMSTVSTTASHRHKMSTDASSDTFETHHAGSGPPAVPRATDSLQGNQNRSSGCSNSRAVSTRRIDVSN